MIPIFRRLRKQLANDNKPIQYLRYAIGEIVLVVIGILIALQINNWNAERQFNIELEAKRQSNLQEIYHDLKKDIIVLDTVLNQLERQKEASVYVIKVLESNDKHISDSLKFFRNFLETVFIVSVDRTKNTWDDLNSSGKLLALKDDTRNDKLFNYYNYYDKRIKQFNELTQEARFNARRVGAPCSSLESLIKFQESHRTINQSADYFSCLLNFPELLSNEKIILDSCYWTMDSFTELKTQAQSIINYMEQNLAQEINLNKTT